MKKRAEENKQKEKNIITVEAEVHWETPRRSSTERKQWELAQMLINQGRFSMHVENTDVNVEVLSPKAKQAVTSKLAKDIAHQFMAQPPVVCPVEPRQQPSVVHPVQPIQPQVQAPLHCLYQLLYIKFDRPLYSHSHNPWMQTLDMLLGLSMK